MAVVSTPVAPEASLAKSMLAAYLAQLAQNPLRTKALTSGTLSGLQELTASKLAGMPKSKNPDDFILGVDKRIVQMTLYGLLVSGPLAHALFVSVTARFLGKEGPLWKIAQILSSQLINSPIQNATYILAMALFAGARTKAQIAAAFRQSYMPMMKTSWTISPLAMIFAQKFLSPNLWVPFFNLVAFLFGTYVNTSVKKARLAQMKREREQREQREKRDD
ncbi:hypothetical protein DFQ27_000444 [Actinomortierella ambigua]|uniref:Integral membrane protein n=1 Tax=Actinomortierella ambigua TaxID=1343610 RepID=A0A9P6QEW6_9FUNG|nr:hypothetical protein DFQ27_000444 [Actinomortierella ambigua]